MKSFLLGAMTATFVVSGIWASSGGQAKTKALSRMEMTVESSLPFDKTIEALKMAGAAEKYGFQGLHPLSDVLASKGFPREKLHILEICQPKAAHDALNNDVMAGLMMPCPIMVWQKGDKVMVSTFDTRKMSHMYRGSAMPEIGNRVYKSLKIILSSVEKRR